MNFGDLFRTVSGLIEQHTRQDPDVNTDSLLSQVGNIFGQHGEIPQQTDGGILPASQDPYGDPADQGGNSGILPASQDPYGDPADQR